MIRYHLDDETQELLEQILWYAADTADLQRDDRTRQHMLEQINALAYRMNLADEEQFLEDFEEPVNPRDRFRIVVDNDRNPDA